MTELARYEPPTTEIQRQSSMQDAAVQRLGAWAHSAQAAYEVAEKLCATSFVPAQFKEKPYEATAAILAGSEVGLSPLAALRSFDIIGGTAAARALTLRAIVQSQGHQMILEESTATRCKMKGRRRGETEWQRVVWTLDRAKDLGLVNKENWKKQPTAMLLARATSELARLVAADAILGIGLSIEEIEDGADPNTTAAGAESPAEPSGNGTRRMSRKRPESRKAGNETNLPASNHGNETNLPASSEQNEQRSRDETEADSGADSEPITEAQRGKLFATFSDLGITEADAQRARISEILGREIDSRKKLTKDDAIRVIDQLTYDIEHPFNPKEGGDD